MKTGVLKTTEQSGKYFSLEDVNLYNKIAFFKGGELVIEAACYEIQFQLQSFELYCTVESTRRLCLIQGLIQQIPGKLTDNDGTFYVMNGEGNNVA